MEQDLQCLVVFQDMEDSTDSDDTQNEYGLNNSSVTSKAVVLVCQFKDVLYIEWQEG